MILNAVVAGFIVLLISCSTSRKAVNTIMVEAGKSDSLIGVQMIKNSDCITCHKIEGELLGPSFVAIAKKYELNADNVDKLSKKIINGGYSVWGSLHMTPHPSMSDETARYIVKYILLLKK